MFKPVVVDAETLKRPQDPMPVDVVNNIFKVFHGFYGNLFLSKFSTGEVDAQGGDAGIVSARQIWGHGLRHFDAGTVKAALAQCLERHFEFPPSLPQFVSMCRANQPREAYRPALPMSVALVAERNKAEREKLRELRQKLKDEAPAAAGIPALFAAIADAVGCAGGDEVAELRRLEGLFA